MCFFDAIGITEPIVVVVHDFGGPWLLSWVAENPKRVRGLLIMNTLFQQDHRWHFWAKIWQIPLLGELAMKLTTRALFRTECKKGSKDLTNAFINETYDRMHPTMQKTVLRSYRGYAKPNIIFNGWQKNLNRQLNKYPLR